MTEPLEGSAPGRQWDFFWAAVMFYTRLPVPSGARHSDEILNRSRQYFPAIGVLVGGIAALVLAGAEALFTVGIAVVPSMAASVLVTGAFHEDGLADSFDGFGASRDPQRILQIMKDSRVGSFGLVGMVLVLLAKYASLVTLTGFSVSTAAIIVVNAHTLSRLAASTVADLLPYARTLDRETSADGSSKIKPIADHPLTGGQRLAGVAWAVPGLVVLAVIDSFTAFAMVAAMVVVVLAAVRYLRARLGGYTGDCLGATQQLAELSGCMVAAAVLV